MIFYRYFKWSPPELGLADELKVGSSLDELTIAQLVQEFESKQEVYSENIPTLVKAYASLLSGNIIYGLIADEGPQTPLIALTGFIFFLYFSSAELAKYRYKQYLGKLQKQYSDFVSGNDTSYQFYLGKKTLIWLACMFFGATLPSVAIFKFFETNRESAYLKLTQDVFTVWAAQGPFASGEESSAALKKAMTALKMDPMNLKSSKGFNSTKVFELHARQVDEKPDVWEDVRKTAIENGGKEMLELGRSLKE